MSGRVPGTTVSLRATRLREQRLCPEKGDVIRWSKLEVGLKVTGSKSVSPDDDPLGCVVSRGGPACE